MPRRERRDARSEHARTVGRRAGEPERAARRRRDAARLAFRVIEVGEQLQRTLVERASGLGQRKPSRRALEQSCVQMRLQVADLTRDGRYRQAEAVRGARETALLDDGHVSLHGLQTIHGILLHLPQQYVHSGGIYPDIGKMHSSTTAARAAPTAPGTP
jgi:hypothetical protein